MRLGYDPIDDYHEQIIAQSQIIKDLLRGECARVEVRDAFAEMLALTEAHFDDEDQLMPASGFPAAAAHMAEHAELRMWLQHTLNDLNRELTASTPSHTAEDALRLLDAWIVSHLETFDAQALPHIAQWQAGRGAVRE